MKVYATVCLLLLTSVIGISALRCYVCDADSLRCEDPVGHDDLISDGSTTYSSTTFRQCIKAYAESDGVSAVARDGSFDWIEEDTCVSESINVKLLNTTAVRSLKAHLKQNVELTACICSTDLCNGASTNSLALAIFAVVPLFLQRLLQ